MIEEVIRAADEGIPIAALKRIFPEVDKDYIREMLHRAVSSGRLSSMPKEDWPPKVTREHRVPTNMYHRPQENDKEAIMRMARKLKTTKLESSVLLVVLRRGHATREQLHVAVEDNRGNPDEITDIKIVDVVVCKLRKKLVPLGLKLTTIHSIGYEMDEANRAKAWEMINAE